MTCSCTSRWSNIMRPVSSPALLLLNRDLLSSLCLGLGELWGNKFGNFEAT